MSDTWAQVIDDFEASLEAAESALDGGAWDEYDWDWEPPSADLGPMGSVEQQRVHLLLIRADDCRRKVGEVRASMAREMETGRKQRSAATSYLISESLHSRAEA
jgi:hypothetical protein